MDIMNMNIPDSKLMVLGVIRDADNALDFETIGKRSGFSAETLEPIIKDLTEQCIITTFQDDAAKPVTARRFHTSINNTHAAADSLVSEHIWELSAMGLLYFAFGCDLDPEQMYVKRCPGSHYLCRASLDGFRLVFDRYSQEWVGGQASFRRSSNSTIWGALYYVNSGHWLTLDEAEITPYCRRVRVPVQTSFGLFCAECYQSFPADIALPSRKYLDKIIKGGQFLGLPQKYLRLVGSIPVAASSSTSLLNQ